MSENTAAHAAPVLTLSPEAGDKLMLEKAVDALNELKTPAAPDAQEALDAALAKYGPEATVISMPFGGSTLPILEVKP